MNQEEVNFFLKAKRDQYVVEIRKQKNEDFITKKRIKLASGSSEHNGSDGPVPQKTHLEVISFYFVIIVV